MLRFPCVVKGTRTQGYAASVGGRREPSPASEGYGVFFGRPWFASGVRGGLPSGSGRSRSAGMYRVTQLQRREACNERGNIERGRCRSGGSLHDGINLGDDVGFVHGW